MERFLLSHEGQRILLSDGETLIGRGVSCDVKFKDPSVSREHVRIVVMDGRAAAANLSANGTLLNGVKLEKPKRLFDGDELRLGFQRIRVEVVAEAADIEDDDQDDMIDLRRPTDRLLADDLDQELTRPGEEGWRKRRRAALTLEPGRAVSPGHAVPPAIGARRPSASRLAEIAIHVCPRCRSHISYTEETCASCGYAWPLDHATARTQDVDIERVSARRDPRFRVEVPIVYSSATLTVDALVRDLSKGGVFIATQVLDPIGTPCDLTARPGSGAELLFAGVVAHVRDDASPYRAAGLGIQFVGGSSDALSWLEHTISRYSEAVVR